MARVIVIDDRDFVAEVIGNCLRESPTVDLCVPSPQKEDGFGGHLSGGLATLFKEHQIDTVVYSPRQANRTRTALNLEEAESVFQQCARLPLKHFILVSSAMIYGASPHNQGFIPESQVISRSDKQSTAKYWIDLEAHFVAYLGELSGTGVRLTILRPAPTLALGGEDYFSRIFRKPLALTLPGHDPTLQLLSPLDLASAVRSVIENHGGEVYNVGPAGVITLRSALRLSDTRRLPVSRMVQWLGRRVLSRLGASHPIDQLDYIRYSWTISDQKLKHNLDWSPSRSSVEALRDFRSAETGRLNSHELPSLEFDDYGMDKRYIEAFGRKLFNFLHDRYWRVEVKGLHHVPLAGRAVLVGIHRGFMPWDAVMTLHLIARNFGRYVRFLIHPGLLKFPFLFNFHTKLGGLIACQENAAWVLNRDGIVGIFPEGIRGAFSGFRDRYKLGKFGRDEYVKIALRNRSPIVPFVTVGSAEIFPILKKVNWAWWRRHTEWPCFPITPTFPFLPPVPLPSKWHTEFLEPIHIEAQYPPEAADDPAIVHAIGNEVRCLMEQALSRMLNNRKSIFYGSIFEERKGSEGKLGEALVYERGPATKRG